MSYVRISYPKVQVFDNNGNFAVGYYIYTFAAGTSTATTTYSERTLTTPNTNPIILDSRGEADIYVGEAVKLVFTIPGGAPTSPIWVVDYIGEQQSNFVTGSATAGTTHNNYVVSTTPAVAALSNNFMLIMTPDIDNVDTMVSTVFTGTGINDLSASGPYQGTTSSVFTVTIDGAGGATDTFKWRKDAGAWTLGVAITAIAQSLIEGVKVTFATTTGHTLADSWAITVETPTRVNLDSLGNLLVYKNKGGSIVLVDGGDMKAGYPAELIVNSALNAWLLINPATPTFTTTTIQAVRYRKLLSVDYTLKLADQGYELSFDTTATLTLLTAPEFANRFFYVKNTGTGVVTVDAGVGYQIFTGAVVGSRYLYVYPGGIYQLQTNAIDWHVMTSIGDVHKVATDNPAAAVASVFTDLLPGYRYKLIGQFLLSANVSVIIYFNNDSANNYLYSNDDVNFGANNPASSIATSSILIANPVSSLYEVSIELSFETWQSDSTRVNVIGRSVYVPVGGGTLSSMTFTGYYDGAANLSSIYIVPSGGTFTGRLALYQYT